MQTGKGVPKFGGNPEVAHLIQSLCWIHSLRDEVFPSGGIKALCQSYVWLETALRVMRLFLYLV